MKIIKWTVLVLLSAVMLLACNSGERLPGLMGDWLLMQVIVTYLAYACFALAFGAALIYLLMTFGGAPKRMMEVFGIRPRSLDVITFTSIVIGFPIFTLGLIFGAIWSNEAWGVYWSWDPKETWQFIAWTAYALFILVRLIKGQVSLSKTNKIASNSVMIASAVIAIIGFVLVIWSDVGVYLLLSEVYPYGSP